VTARIGYALLRPTVRAMKWGPFAAGAGLGLAVLIVPEILSLRLTAAHLTTLLRVAAACGALGVTFLLDDPATRSTPAVPTSRLIRHAVRAAVALPVVAASWAAALAIAASAIGAGPGVARGALTVEAAALVAVALVLAAIGQRLTSDGAAGVLAAPGLLILLAIAWFLPPRVALIVAPTDPHWAPAHQRWAALLIAAVIGFAWASHEPARRGSQRASVGASG
jgi:hypothetical protein